MNKSSIPWFVYLLECTNGKLYCGIATDVEKRFNTHSAGRGARFTLANPPLRIIAAKLCRNRSEASKLEWAIKQLKPEQKRANAKNWSKATLAKTAN